jgi:hypothetical protein
MIKYEPLSTKKHKNFSIIQNFPLKFCMKESFCPILIEEVERAASQAPVVFMKKDQNSFDLVMLLSLKQEQNNFLNSSLHWTGGYMPATYRCYPFALLTEKPSEKKILGFDAASGIVTGKSEENSKRLFEDDGTNSEHLSNIINFLNAIERKKQQTFEVLETVNTYNLFEEWELKVSNNGKTENIKGLWKVSKDKLDALSPKEFAHLREIGSLQMIYGHLVSLFTLRNLIVANEPNNDKGTQTLVDRTKEKQEKASKQNVDSLVQDLLLDD